MLIVIQTFNRDPLASMQKKEGEDICILIHSNRICIVTLAPSHPILEKKKKVTGVNFNVGKVNRLDNKVSGKGKRGAQWLGPSSTLCSLSCEDGSIYDVCSGIKGQLIEVNEALIHSPHLINEEPLNTGYIGILLPPLKEHQQETERLLTEDQYQEVLRERQSACT
ncbi:protein Simiate-like isoform X2 [Pomacea canaliculata]|uniref:protein Simiate-like isoform X2 n=1 Tax=Pomacea canaliculata TaxID=400727 RepID=UPI000D72FAB8|nr:protein Simiate-like isoform X2 [Pomacea canaliculata]